jgi:ankyrin repeat protein
MKLPERETDVRQLARAIQNGELASVAQLLENTDLLADLQSGRLPIAPLCIAAEHNRTSIVCQLIEAGLQVDQLDPTSKRTPLEIAAAKGHRELCYSLLKHGADPSRKSRGTRVPSALALASFLGDLELVDSMLAAGGDPQDVCSGGTVSLIRIRGDVLRRLERAGGELPSDVKALLRMRQALGDQD